MRSRGLNFVLLLAILFGLTWARRNRLSRLRSHPSTVAPSTQLGEVQPGLTVPNAIPAPGTSSVVQRKVQQLRDSNSAAENRRILLELRVALAAMAKSEASSTIREMLSSGVDVQTQIEFEVGDGGRLQGANTLRVFLLDNLGAIDPKAAAEIARGILIKPESPDEWAICLRNLAKGDSSEEAQRFLRDRLRILLRHEPWQNNPSIGYLEAFDTTVYIGGYQLVPELTRLMRLTNNPGVAHAAFLAVDRLAANEPAATLSSLAEDWTLMQGREATRAGFFARADVSNAEQRQLVERYLLTLPPGSPELDAFADVFPNENYRISKNLLTVTPPRSGSVIQQRDRATLLVIEEWMAEKRFQGVLPQLRTVQNRLRTFTAPER